MKKLSGIIAVAAFATLATACSGPAPEGEASEAASSTPAESHEVEGFWRHDELTTSKGDDLPIRGSFLFHDGIFIEEAVMDSPSAKNSEAMAHTGPYEATATGVKLTAAPTIAISAGAKEPLSFTPSTMHMITAENTGDHLTLTFGSGTKQTFTRIPASSVEVITFKNGRLALTPDRFILVAGDASGVLSGYGTYTRDGDKFTFSAERWAGSTPTKADIRLDTTIEGTLDKTRLKLSDGHAFDLAQ